tara:strand:+ start:274 stop:531 length:258 start_codon:yes stop_codon:yes gene_type:complete
MASQWITHVKKVSKEKGIPYNEALKVAGKTFKKKDEKPAGRAKAQTKKDRLNESEGKAKGMKKDKQTTADRLDEAEGKKKGRAKK